MTINRRHASIVVVTCALALAAFAAPAQEPVVLNISHQFSAGTGEVGDFRDRLVRKFASQVEERSGGSLKFAIHPASSLMKPLDQWEAMARGSLDLALAPLAYAGAQVPEFNIGLMPALVADYAQARRWRDAPIGVELGRIAERRGIKLLTWVWQAGAFASREKPILGPADVKARKVRGGSREIDLVLEMAGAIVTNLPSAEIGEALRSGALDVVLTSSASLLALGVHEQATYLTSARDKSIWFMLQPLAMSKASFDKLTPEQQAIVIEVGASLEQFGMDAAQADDLKLAEHYLQQGAEVHDLAAAAFAQWRELSKTSAWKAFAEKVPNGRQLLDLAVALE